MSFIRQHKGAVIWSVAMHVAVAAAVLIGLPWRMERPPAIAVAAAPIQGVIVDQAAIDREKARRDEAARAERQRQQQAERQRREEAEQQRLAEQRERQRVANEQRAREDAQRKEEERLAAERAEQRRREEQAKAEREEAERRAEQQAEQRRRQQAEAELQAQLAAEAEANAARAAGLLDQYMLMIENHVKRHWQRPLSARPGIECVVSVVQLPTGDVVSAKVERCNGDAAVRTSIENAVLAASPLPRPPSQAVFSRTFTLTFAPDK
jgi:colicin import membrane protein